MGLRVAKLATCEALWKVVPFSSFGYNKGTPHARGENALQVIGPVRLSGVSEGPKHSVRRRGRGRNVTDKRAGWSMGMDRQESGMV